MGDATRKGIPSDCLSLPTGPSLPGSDGSHAATRNGGQLTNREQPGPASKFFRLRRAADRPVWNQGFRWLRNPSARTRDPGDRVVMVAIGYVRVSTEGQVEDGVSLDAQRAKLEAWAKLHDEPELVVFEDAGISGSSMAPRPGLKDALDAVCKHKGVLVVYSLSRLARSTRDTLGISDRLAKAGAELVSLSEKIDTTSASGKMIFRLLAVLAEFERDQVAERTKSAMAHMRKTGRRISRFAPFGWDFDETGAGLVENPTEQVVLARIRTERSAGLTLRAIVSGLEDSGVPTKRGGTRWSAKVIRTILLRTAPA